MHLRPTMLMDCRIVWNGHHIELMAVHRAANWVKVDDRRELAAVLAQKQLHVYVGVMTKFLGLDGLRFRWQNGRAALVFLRGNHRGVRRVCSCGGDAWTTGGCHGFCTHSSAICTLTDHRWHGKVMFYSLSFQDLNTVDCHWFVPVYRKQKTKNYLTPP